MADGLEELADEAVGRPVGEADLAAGRQTRTSSAAAWSWSGVNITPKVETHDVEAAILERQGLGIGLTKVDGQALGLGTLACALQQGGHVVGRCHVAPATRGGQADVAVAGGDVEHLLARTQVECLAQLFADDLQGGADDGVVAGRPGGLLAGLDRSEVGHNGLAVLINGNSSGIHAFSPFDPGWFCAAPQRAERWSERLA